MLLDRDSIYKTRKRAKFFLSSRLVDRRRINLGGLRKLADFSFDVPLYSSSDSLGKVANRLMKSFEKIDSSNLHVIFVNIDLAPHLKSIFTKLQDSFDGIYIIDTRDQSLTQKPDWVGSKATWAAPHIQDPESSSGLCIPVGLEERRRLENNLPLPNRSKSKLMKILVGPFAVTHPNRANLMCKSNTPVIDVYRDRVNSLKYGMMIQKYSFVLCPRGNGIDTHRVWETLCANNIPIVEDSEWAGYFRRLGFPFVILENLEEVWSWDAKTISKIYFENASRLSHTKTLLSNVFWFNHIQTFSNKKP